MTEEAASPDGNEPEGSAGVDESRDENLCTVELTTRAVMLLLEYGYPFPAEEQKLRTSKAVSGIHRVQLGSYWIEMLGDLVRSARKIHNHRLLEEIDELSSVLVSSLNSGLGVRLP